MFPLKRLFSISKYILSKKTFFNTNEYKCKPLYFNVQHVLSRSRCDMLQDEDEKEMDEMESYMYQEMSNEYFSVLAGGHRVLVIQPYIKWGENKKRITTPKLQLEEAEALIRSLPYWTIVHSMTAPLMSFKSTYIFGSGSLNNLKNIIHNNPNITAVFISLDTIKFHQAKALRQELGVAVFDRYSLIIQIFKIHAKSAEAKIQVALAEIPYLRRQINSLTDNNVGMINFAEHRKKILEARESKLKKKLEKVKEYRNSLRTKRQSYDIPIIAVVGYTNSGKTSLIKALTGDSSLKPRNRLFATLDSTMHEGVLPCRMKALYVDTIGFIQDVPEMLIEPFKTTLEDALIADIIIHVYDCSHPDREAQIQHVEDTIRTLFVENQPLIINVANKCDLIKEGSVPGKDIPIVATKSIGIDLLRHRIQDEILTSTNRKVMTMRVRAGSPAEAWLYKEMTVINAEADANNLQYSLLDVITTDFLLFKFKRYLREKKTACL